MAPGDLAQALCGLDVYRDVNVLVGFEGASDAGVYRVREDLAIVNTVDFFTPIVDDPYVYGQIAAANALSDVYVMGATPITALNLVAFPSRTMDLGILRKILQGGAAELREAEVNLIGGHSIEDAEIKYGLSVTGIVHPQQMIRNSGAVPGDRLVLTKPLGTGIVNTGIKKGVVDSLTIEEVQRSMIALNRKSSEIMRQFAVHACTDVTGFGLLGHLAELLENSGAGAVLYLDKIPHFSQALRLAAENFVPGGTFKNREFRNSAVSWPEGVAEEYVHLLYDPQTSGGLLISTTARDADPLLRSLHQSGITQARIIGEITAEAAKIRVQDSEGE